MATRHLPTPERLRQLLSYDPTTGIFRHRPRTTADWPNAKNPEHTCKTWNKRLAGKIAGTHDGKGYIIIGVEASRTRAHRMAWAMTFGRWPTGEIDHINGIKDDNRIANLREVSPSENRRNCKRFSSNTSGFPGVSWSKLSLKWESHIKVDGRKISLGLHAELSDAIAARKKAEIAHNFHKNHGRDA